MSAVKPSSKIGLSPGSMVYIGRKRKNGSQISVIDYNKDMFAESRPKSIEESFVHKDTSSITWINIDGLQDTRVIETIGENFGIHPLTCEDILNTHQRPKAEFFDDYVFITLKMFSIDENNLGISSEQISIVFGKNYVLSFQERPGDFFDPLRERIRGGKGRIRKMGPDYLVYALMDIIIDNYFLMLERIGEQIEAFEETLMAEPKKEILNSIYSLKREMLFVRKSVWPLRESISRLEKSESRLISRKTLPFMRDLYDHTIQIIDTIETSRDLLSGMLDLYLSSVSNRMNEVMKVLTIIATIFIPLTFIAGVYGMNFEHMPELAWRYSYLLVWIFMLIAGMIMLLFFRRKRWI